MRADAARTGIGASRGRGVVGPGTRVAAGDLADRLAWWSFTLLVVISPFRAHVVLLERPVPPVYGAYTDFVVAWSELAIATTIAAWLASLLLRPRPVELGPRSIRWPVGVLIALAWITAAWSVDPPLAASNALALTLGAAVAVYAVNAVEDLDRLVPALVVMIAVQVAVALAQVAGQSSVGLSALGEYVVTPATAGASVVAAADGTRFLRGYGLTDHPNILGGILVASGFLIVLGGRRLAGLTFVVLVVASVALLVTFSRAAWLAAGVGSLIGLGILIRMRDRPALRRMAGIALAGGVCAFVAAIPLAPYLATRLEPGRQDVPLEARSVDERAALAGAALRIVATHPLTGVGAGALPIALQEAEPDFGFSYQPAHLVPLTVAAEVGVAGATAYLAATVAPLVLLVRARRRLTRALAATSAALVALTVVGLFDYYPWTFPAGRTWWWLVLGLWVVAWRRSAVDRPDPGNRVQATSDG